MRSKRRGRWLAAATVLALSVGADRAEAVPSQRVYLDEEGRLRSLTDDSVNRIPDFSHAGYRGGGVALPRVPVVQTIAPVAGDNTAQIQAAIDAAAALPLDANGLRGAVLLEAGRYEVAGTVHLDADGVVLRGVGDGTDPATNTAIVRIGASLEPVVVIGGGNDDRWAAEEPDSRSDIVTDYVQVGSMAFEVADPGLYAVGDNIIVRHPCTLEWLEAIDYGATDVEPPWTEGSRPLVFNRVITAIDGDMIHIDAPVFNHLDRSLAQSFVYRLDRTGIVSQVGIEDLRVEIDSDVVMHAVSFTQAENGWARNLTVRDFLLGGIHMATSKHLTVSEVRAVDPKGPTIGGRKYNFMAAGAQLVLVEDGYARGGRHSFASNGTSWDSGVVFLRGVAAGSLSPSEGHHRWSMGLLYDGHTEQDVVYDGILLGLYNRGSYGTGHGWATAHSVAWNCDLAGGHGVGQRPPTAQNYFIGCAGQIDGDGPFAQPTGYIEATGQSIEPLSLYEAQLADRLAFGPPPTEPPPGFDWIEVAPQADAFVRGGSYSADSYGDAETLVVKAGNPDFTRESFLRFEVDGVADDFTQVQLRLRQDGLGFGGMRYGIATTDPVWDEATITFDDQPASDEAFDFWFPEQAHDSLVDVTAAAQEAIAAGQPLSLRIWATEYYGGPAASSFGSKEAGAQLQPALVFTVPEPEVPPDDTGGEDTGGTGGGGADTSGGQPPGTTTGVDDPSGSTGAGAGADGAGGTDQGCGCRLQREGEPAAWAWWPWLVPLVSCRRSAARDGSR